MSVCEEIFPEITSPIISVPASITPSTTSPVSYQQPKTAHNIYSSVLFERKAGYIAVSHSDKMIIDELLDNYKCNQSNIEKCIAGFMSKLHTSNKGEFYPLVASLLRIVGYKCEHSRLGVNYQRWDAMLIDSHESIPIEIKSPGEEQYISVKAIRQALENKIILLSRKPYPTKMATTSLVIGYYIPNDRSEVIQLIEDIYKSFGIRIGIIDFPSLLRLCYEHIINKNRPKYRDMVNLYGFIKL